MWLENVVQSLGEEIGFGGLIESMERQELVVKVR